MMARMTDPLGGGPAMPNLAAIVRLTAAELSIGAIKPVTVLSPTAPLESSRCGFRPAPSAGHCCASPPRPAPPARPLYVRVRPQFGPADPTGYHHLHDHHHARPRRQRNREQRRPRRVPALAISADLGARQRLPGLPRTGQDLTTPTLSSPKWTSCYLVVWPGIEPAFFSPGTSPGSRGRGLDQRRGPVVPDSVSTVMKESWV
jgi:hypothetical protein